MQKKKSDGDLSAANIFTRTAHSIRTQYSIATAFFLLLILGVFYIGGRIVLVHLVRDAEQQVREIGADISRIAYRNADSVRRNNVRHLPWVAKQLAGRVSPAEIMSDSAGRGFSLLVDYTANGEFVAGCVRTDVGPRKLDAADLAAYAEQIGSWIQGLSGTNDAATAVGIMHVGSRSHYVSLTRYGTDKTDGYAVLGSLFDSSAFSAQVNEGFGGFEVRVSSRKTDVNAPTVRNGAIPGSSLRERNSFGLAPMLSEALDFYSGGFWDIGGNSFEAVFAIRDIAGNPITMIAVSLPKTFTNVTRSALGRLTFFISMAGIVLILPIFWFQGRVLLNPLTKMTEAIRNLGQNHTATDCPRIEWEGKDEFAHLAASVNRMLETISARTVELAQLESRQRAMIACVPDALVVFDRAGRLVSVIKQSEGKPVPGLAADEKPLIELCSEGQASRFLERLEQTFATGQATMARGRTGEESDPYARYFELRLSRMDDHFALGIIRDMTREVGERRRRVEAEKRASDFSKRESLTLLAAGIAHDVNNVLSVILNTAESALAGSIGEGVRQEMDAIRDAVKRGSAMTKELMAYAGQSKIMLVRANAGMIIKDVQMIADRVVGKNIVLCYRFGDNLPDVDADPNQFWKVLFNIIKNASEAIGQRPGTICLSAEPFEMTAALASVFISERPLAPGKGVMFRIADDGPGIRPELLPRLFDPYVSSKALGRGLGLATVRTIVESHGGGIRVTSQVDIGTTFHVFLPESKLARESEEPAGKQRARGELPTEVLLVDNDEAILQTTSILLKVLKVETHVAHNRHESLAILRRFSSRIGAIILDANLGGIDTLRLLDAFRIASPQTPIIVSSGSSEESMRKMFAAHPYDAFLAKPYTMDELKEILVSCASRRENLV